MKGRLLPLETRRKIAKAMRGRRLSAETRARMSEAHRHRVALARSSGPRVLGATGVKVCLHGHPLHGPEDYYFSGGRQRCKECARASKRAYLERVRRRRGQVRP